MCLRLLYNRFFSSEPYKIPKKLKNIKYKKKNIPKGVREQVWIQYIGKKFQSKCYISWCKNKMDVFNFHVGHNIPEKNGGDLSINNLRPICARCNLSMSCNYTIDEWNNMGQSKHCNII